MSRRAFLALGGAAGVGVVIGYVGYPLLNPPHSDPRESAPRLTREPWIWIKVSPDNAVTVVLHRCEMGQGSLSALAMLVAEELDVEWGTVRTEWAPPDPEVYGLLRTGASDAVRLHYDPLRRAGAIARSLLISAAAGRWGVETDACATDRGLVLHEEGGRSLSYGSLANDAGRLPIPGDVELKSPEGYSLIGHSVPRLDVPSKVRGETVYGIDVRIPGMLTATIVHCPVHEGRLTYLDSRETREVPGVRDVVRIDRSGSSGTTAVAVVAEDFWTARKGLDALRLEWDGGVNGRASSETIRKSLDDLAASTAKSIVNVGDVDAALSSSARTVSAAYYTPFLAHAPMEPMSCAASVRPDRCEVWAPTQDPAVARSVAATASGVRTEDVVIHQCFIGGSFGRRQRSDFIAEAVKVARAVRVPIKMIWTREEDIRHDYYRPATLHQLTAGLDRRGLPIAWSHRVAGVGGSDTLLIQGIDGIPYAIDNRRIDLVRRRRGVVRTGPWRGLARSQNSFVTECFLDEIARAGGNDPLELRLELLASAPRFRAVLELAAEKAGWGDARSAGRHLGVAIGENFQAICALVAEVSVDVEKDIRVHRIVCAADCGRLVHPDTVRAQLEGGIVFGLSAALRGRITIESGRVLESNFHDYPVLRMNEIPIIEVHLVASTDRPGAVGETSLGPVAPAVANAVRAADGRQIRELPLLRSSG